jgi:hypothetical protein
MTVSTAASGQDQTKATRARPGGLAERFEQLDRNGDGRVTREESANARWFDTRDRNRDGLIALEGAKPAATIGAARAQEYDWTTHAAMGDVLKRDRLVFYNNRWAGEKGSIFVKYGPPTCTWWTTHEGPVDPTFPVSAPLVGFGNFWGSASDNNPLPIRLRDLEVFKASLSVALPGAGKGRLAKDMPSKQKQGPKVMPAGTGHMYRICWQFYFTDNPATGKYNKGDFAPTIFAVNCHPTWWGKDAGKYESRDRTWKICDCNESSGMGRYIVPLLDPFPVPDADGKIEIRDVDLKSMIDWCIAKGYYRPDDYLVFASASWEVWVLDQPLKMNDMCFVIKVKGEPELTVPSWSKLPSKSRSAQEAQPAVKEKS